MSIDQLLGPNFQDALQAFLDSGSLYFILVLIFIAVVVAVLYWPW